jgi:hypothetical protein
MARASIFVGFLVALAISGCATYQQELDRGQRHFKANEYEKSLAVLRALEPDINSLNSADRTRYAYLRGMTDFRLSYRADARYWLGIAAAQDKLEPGGLEEGWKQRMKEALTQLNADVYGGAEANAASKEKDLEVPPEATDDESAPADKPKKKRKSDD